MALLDLLGTEVVGFRLTELLGQGGMAAVFKGENTLDSTIQRAIKVVRPELAERPEFLSRFAEEARILERLQHPNIVRFFGVRKEREWLVMELELLHGRPVSEWQEQLAGKMAPLGDVVSWVQQAAEGVAAAHQMGVVHRDLKPDNLYLAEDGAIKVLDFGIARAIDEADRADKATREGTVPGSPAFMAPEVCHGSVPSAAADVYALGITLYELILGHHPLTGAGDQRRSTTQLMFAHVQTPLPDVQERRPDVPAPLEAVMRRAAAKDPADRFQNAQELADALRGVLPILPKPTGIGAVGASQHTEFALPTFSAPSSAGTTGVKTIEKRAGSGGRGWVAPVAIVSALAIGGGIMWQVMNADPKASRAASSPAAPTTAAQPSPDLPAKQPEPVPDASPEPVAEPKPPKPKKPRRERPWKAHGFGEDRYQIQFPGEWTVKAASGRLTGAQKQTSVSVGFVLGSPALERALEAAEQQWGKTLGAAVSISERIDSDLQGMPAKIATGTVGGSQPSQIKIWVAKAPDGLVTLVELWVDTDDESDPATSPEALLGRVRGTIRRIAPVREPEKNRWVRVNPGRRLVTLGVQVQRYGLDPRKPKRSDRKKLAGVVGLRPSRNVASPTAAFDMHQHEVTWEELDGWLAENPNYSFSRHSGVSEDAATRAAMPAQGVPWSVAYKYCQGQGGSLPTEEQWEFAARGPELRHNPWGADKIDLFRTNAYAGEKAIVAKPMASDQDRTPGAGAAAIHDLAGNLQEWTLSIWREDEPGQDESWVQAGETTYRTVRGLPLKEAPPQSLPLEGATYRAPLCATGPCVEKYPEARRFVGFRCVRPVTQKGR